MKLYHVSEEPDIRLFQPRQSPSQFDSITGDVVFAISEELLHNYLLPRDCPRIAFYASSQTSEDDKNRFFGNSTAKYILAIESKWFHIILRSTIYCYEVPGESFHLLDACAGYYISYNAVRPITVQPINDIFQYLFNRNIEIRIMPSLQELAESVSGSTLNFSLIRMRNASTIRTDKINPELKT